VRIAGRASSALLLSVAALLCAGAGARAATVTEFADGISLFTAPAAIAAGPDGNMWFTEPDADQVAKITPDGVVTEFFEGIATASAPLGITAGPDANLWFTEYDAGQIGRITPAGVVDEFADGISDNSSPRDIVAGPDGALWYTDTNGRRIGRITTAGVVTEYGVDRGFGGGPSDIAVGPDGNIWFTESGGVGRITTAGSGIMHFPDGGSEFGIAAGPDGNLWTTQYYGPIRRITTAGVVTGTFALPPYVLPFAIARGPDDNMWFTDSADDSIGRITPAGAFVLVKGAITPGSDPRDIAAGPDGNLWFTEPGFDQVARITPSIEAPAAAVADATAIGPRSATLNGTVDARSLSTSVRFEYGPTTAYGSQTAVQETFEPSAEAVSAAVIGLEPATTYHFRLIATSGAGSAQSADRMFTTSAPLVAAQPPPAAAPPPPPACSNGLDDDRDGFADGSDPHCHSDADRRVTGSFAPQDTSESPVDDPVVVCSAAGLALVSAELTSARRRVRLRGVTDSGQAGRRVALYADGRRVARAPVRPDGSFTASVNAARRAPAEVRYQARLGARRSQTLVAQRRFAAIRLAIVGAKVTLSGRARGRRPRGVELLGRTGGCGPYQRLATARVRAGGTFTLSAPPYANLDIATYRVRIVAAGAGGARESTPPRGLRLR
jgi:streptogramin lyase